MTPSLTLYSRPGCCLCDDMKAIVAEVQADTAFTVTEVDISARPELEARFGQDIPVLFINGRKAFKYRVTVGALRRRLHRSGAETRALP
ncbi:MAG: glutaredoxin family protein [Desulfurellaceae bacterium]|nr:glutaredoxin family protein [Desulfurellaceae bacterium]